MSHTLPELPYGYDALEPYIDAKTMEIHHGKHHQAYVDNLNKALAGRSDLEEKSLEELLQDLESVPEDIRTAVKNHGGGHYNHSFFWPLMRKDGGGEPKGELAQAISQKFGDFAKFKEAFTTVAQKHFGSGWAWLVKDSSGNLKVYSTSNQDCPISEGLKPILCLDVWEHAYYLKYQNRRPQFIDAWWNVLNWEQAEENFGK